MFKIIRCCLPYLQGDVEVFELAVKGEGAFDLGGEGGVIQPLAECAFEATVFGLQVGSNGDEVVHTSDSIDAAGERLCFAFLLFRGNFPAQEHDRITRANGYEPLGQVSVKRERRFDGRRGPGIADGSTYEGKLASFVEVE